MAVIQIQTLDQRMQQIRRRLLNNNSNDFTVAPGSPVSDVLIVPQAVSDVQQNAISYLVAVSLSIPDILATEQDQNTLNLLAQSLNTTVSDVISQLSEFLDNWGENFGESRNQPTSAVGSVKYGRVTAPTADLNIGIGKIVKSSGGVEFSTTASVTMFAASAGSYFDPDQLLYVIEVPVQAANPGSNGNAPVGSITSIVTAVNGFSQVTNTEPIVGGNDLETDASFGARLLQKWQAFGKLTQAGVNDSVRSTIASVQDVYVAKTGDPLSLRGNGKTDIWFKGEAPTQATESFTAFNHPTVPNAILPTNRPVLSLSSVDSGSAVLRPDPGTAFEGSVQSFDAIQFTLPPTFPVQVTYIYDAAVANVQNVFNDGANAPLNQLDPSVSVLNALNTPILAKRAEIIEVDYTVNIMVAPGQSPITVKAAVAANLAAFSNTYEMGPDNGTGFPDDLNKVVEGTPGVLRITSVSLFAPTGQTGVATSIVPGNNQYLQLNNVNVF